MPETRDIGRIVRAYLAELAKHGIKVERAYLFGSQARGDTRPESDIDLLLVSRDFATVPVAEQWRILGKAALALMEPVEALTYTPEEVEALMQQEGSFVRHILTRPETIEYHVSEAQEQ